MSNVALVVDDSRSIRMLVTRSLRSAGFEVLEAGNGREALEVLAQRSDISVVVTDLNMPVMDGLELIRGIRDHSLHHSVPVVFLTTESETAKRAEASAAGAAGYVLKPFNAEKIQKAVAQALNAERASARDARESDATSDIAAAPAKATAESAVTTTATTHELARNDGDIRRPTPAADAVEIWGSGNAAPPGLFESVEFWGPPQPNPVADPSTPREPSVAPKAEPPSHEPLALHATRAAAAAAAATVTAPLPAAQRVRPVRPAPLSAPPAGARAVPTLAAPKSRPAPSSIAAAPQAPAVAAATPPKPLYLPLAATRRPGQSRAPRSEAPHDSVGSPHSGASLAGFAHVALPRTFTIATARETRDELLIALDAADHIILDASRVEEVDVAGQLLCAAHHESDSANKSLTMPGGPGERMLAVARTVGFCRTKACHAGCFWLDTVDHDGRGHTEEVRP